MYAIRSYYAGLIFGMDGQTRTIAGLPGVRIRRSSRYRNINSSITSTGCCHISYRRGNRQMTTRMPSDNLQKEIVNGIVYYVFLIAIGFYFSVKKRGVIKKIETGRVVVVNFALIAA